MNEIDPNKLTLTPKLTEWVGDAYSRLSKAVYYTFQHLPDTEKNDFKFNFCNNEEEIKRLYAVANSDGGLTIKFLGEN